MKFLSNVSAMENRKSERVQFFSFGSANQIVPVWVFRKSSPDSILGLVTDVSAEGLQVLTDRGSLLNNDFYSLTAHVEGDEFPAFVVKRIWSREEGTLYLRNGFRFWEAGLSQTSIGNILASTPSNVQWLRCELLDLDSRQ